MTLCRDDLDDVTEIDEAIDCGIDCLVVDSHDRARRKGFYDALTTFGEKIALCHSELSEALEAHRKNLGEEAIAEELADAVIRIADLAGWLKIDLGYAIVCKARRNEQRPYKHGKAY